MRHAFAQIDADRTHRCGIGQHIYPATAVEHVIAVAALDIIVATTRRDDIVAILSEKLVGKAPADQRVATIAAFDAAIVATGTAIIAVIAFAQQAAARDRAAVGQHIVAAPHDDRAVDRAAVGIAVIRTGIGAGEIVEEPDGKIGGDGAAVGGADILGRPETDFDKGADAGKARRNVGGDDDRPGVVQTAIDPDGELGRVNPDRAGVDQLRTAAHDHPGRIETARHVNRTTVVDQRRRRVLRRGGHPHCVAVVGRDGEHTVVAQSKPGARQSDGRRKGFATIIGVGREDGRKVQHNIDHTGRAVVEKVGLPGRAAPGNAGHVEQPHLRKAGGDGAVIGQGDRRAAIADDDRRIAKVVERACVHHIQRRAAGQRCASCELARCW